MRSTIRAVVIGTFLMLPIACGEATGTPTEFPSPAATVVASHTPTAVSPTHSTATASATATPVASATATWDPTRSAAVTLEAIRVAVTASGVPEGSTEFEVQVAATRCAVIPPATSTPLPWQLAPGQPYLVSTNCVGSDLPGQAIRVWQDGVWMEAESFTFANRSDLEVAEQRYLEYLDVISFRDGPPADDFEARLGNYMNSLGTAAAPESCLADEITGRVVMLAERGYYVRLTYTQPILWSGQDHLFVSVGDIQLALPWSTSAVRQELVEVATGKTVKQASLARFAGTAWLTFDSRTHQWYVTDDDSGYYCAELAFFVE